MESAITLRVIARSRRAAAACRMRALSSIQCMTGSTSRCSASTAEAASSAGSEPDGTSLNR